MLTDAWSEGFRTKVDLKRETRARAKTGGEKNILKNPAVFFCSVEKGRMQLMANLNALSFEGAEK